MRPARSVAAALTGLAGLFLLLAIPEREPPVAVAPARGGAFTWNRDAYWRALEARYAAARAGSAAPGDAGAVRALAAKLESVSRLALGPEAPVLDSIETTMFELGPDVALHPALLGDYVALHGRWREVVKDASRRWDVTGAAARSRLYRTLYGGRAAVEEAMLQHPGSVAPLFLGRDEPSATPSATVRGVRVHSGDILVSRGGAPTSALIARGNDYPGNFSHVALVYVDSATGAAWTIEAHIEVGVVAAPAERYLADKKLRIMVLRLRADLPALRADPLLPHRAASAAFERARSGHVAYDFAMDYADPSKLFCSEVASTVYRERGVTLWTGLSTISAPGLRRWLASFGVRHFETQEPSDLEYDPQLVVVAEWRDPDWLRKDHVDNAVIDAMLEGADRGDDLAYPWYALPFARLAKGYSWVLERFGRAGPVPEGMSAGAALRNRAFSDRQRRLAAEVAAGAARFTAERGYPPPYWGLVDLARAAVQRKKVAADYGLQRPQDRMGRREVPVLTAAISGTPASAPAATPTGSRTRPASAAPRTPPAAPPRRAPRTGGTSGSA